MDQLPSPVLVVILSPEFSLLTSPSTLPLYGLRISRFFFEKEVYVKSLSVLYLLLTLQKEK